MWCKLVVDDGAFHLKYTFRLRHQPENALHKTQRTHFMCSMREIHSCNVHPGLDHLLGHGHRPRGRPCTIKFLQAKSKSKTSSGVTRTDFHGPGVCVRVFLTDCADDASVAGHSGLRVDVQQAHVLDEGVGHGGVQLLGVDDGGLLRLRHDWCLRDYDCRKRSGEVIDFLWITMTFSPIHFSPIGDRLKVGNPNIHSISIIE